MPKADSMTVDERRKHLKLVVPRYAKALSDGQHLDVNGLDEEEVSPMKPCFVVSFSSVRPRAKLSSFHIGPRGKGLHQVISSSCKF